MFLPRQTPPAAGRRGGCHSATSPLMCRKLATKDISPSRVGGCHAKIYLLVFIDANVCESFWRRRRFTRYRGGGRLGCFGASLVAPLTGRGAFNPHHCPDGGLHGDAAVHSFPSTAPLSAFSRAFFRLNSGIPEFPRLLSLLQP